MFCVGRDLCLHYGGKRWVFFPLTGKAIWGGVWSFFGKPVCWWLICDLVLLVTWVRSSVLGAAGRWVLPGLGYRWRRWCKFSLINNTAWGEEFSGNPVSGTHRSQPRDSGPVSDWGRKIPQTVVMVMNEIKTSTQKQEKQETKNALQINGNYKIWQITKIMEYEHILIHP